MKMVQLGKFEHPTVYYIIPANKKAANFVRVSERSVLMEASDDKSQNRMKKLTAATPESVPAVNQTLETTYLSSIHHISRLPEALKRDEGRYKVIPITEDTPVYFTANVREDEIHHVLSYTDGEFSEKTSLEPRELIQRLEKFLDLETWLSIFPEFQSSFAEKDERSL